MAYCGPKGIPDSHFLGGPLVWTDLDREKALAWQALEAEKCSGCGTRPAEWNENKGGRRDAYTADLDVCLNCAQIERMRNTAQTSPDYKDRRGLRIVLKRR